MSLNDLYAKLAEQYGAQSGEMVFTFSDKGSMHSYINFYESYFHKKKDGVRLLEIGLMTGGSMHLWQKYFTNYKMVGIDIGQSWNQPRPFQADIESDPDIEIIFGISSRDPIPSYLGDKKFDFIIDDGDHKVISQMETFANYYNLLAVNGTYFIEDIISETELSQLRRFLLTYRENNRLDFTFTHYAGFKNNRHDDQILAITRHR